MQKTYMITSALPYANGALHLGHLAGAYLPADIYVRYLRLMGRNVLWVCGSDEHGAAITIRAKKEGVAPQEIIDKYHALNKDTFERLGISFDYYHRTSAALHHETSQDFFLRLYARGDQFEERVIEQYYDEAFQQFLADRYIIGTCPRCGHPEAYGDQCESCGATLSPNELLEPRSTLSGAPPVRRPTKHWYFRLDTHEAWLREWLEKGVLDGSPHHDPSRWKNHVLGQCLSWLDSGLLPRAITRDLDWGIPVPLPDDEAKGKALYVWFDAPIGYISSTRQWALENGEDWERYWKGDHVELIHFIGKDNIVFHCIVFPAMLKAYGGFALPRNVPANQFLNFEGRKFSKSKGWGIEQHDYLEAFNDFPNKEDALRYALIRNLPENRDADFKWDEFVDFHDKELADNLGNFINRAVVLTEKYFGGTTPENPPNLSDLLGEVFSLARRLIGELEAFNFKSACQVLMEISSFGNTFLQDRAPWALYKEDPADPRIAETMAVCLEVVALLALLCEPFIPFTSPRIRKLIGMPPVQRGELAQALETIAAGRPLIPSGHQIGAPEVLFPKIHDRKDLSRLAIVERQKEILINIMEKEKAQEREAFKAEIQYDDFARLDIRTATILEAEKVPQADKLLKIKVDLGSEQRTIVSGIAQHFDPAKIIGQQVLVVANLAPRKLRGIESQGMILTAENAAGELMFVCPAQPFGNGFVVK